ncbi:penicillin-binding protein [Lyngbya confervoides BDU141951]|uniref:Penicillin-binding protein n=3 Tax=Lyngbya TaxID=28073 RepID=A0ABD4T425_9CYAN|nr:transglycosylase domain-containing protein [Lyngbya confervoides]MCM1983190.1 penicillin-binding protein [Lyngbya confervoides BDU141951]
MLGSTAVAGALVGLAISFRDLPNVRSLKGYIPSETTYIYDVNGKVLASFHGEENREVVTLDQVSPEMKLAVLAMEDSNFYQHNGVNPIGIARAAIINFSQGETAQGASTLTMQLAKNLFLSPKQVLSRKVSEAVLAMRMEKMFSKDEILEMYLNQVYWGHNTYGVQTAAKSYFKKSAADLNLAEAAMMAGIIQAPEAYSPFLDFPEAKTRQGLVLDRMVRLGWASAAEAEAAKQEPLTLGNITSFQRSRSPYVTNTVVKELEKRFGRDSLNRGGMRVQSTVDYRMQEAAEETIQYWHSHSLRYYADQMALVAVDPRTHYIKAIVGGVDRDKSEFNRATQAMRQPGSSFKPFVYYTAFASGRYDPSTVVNDNPVSFDDGSAERYVPQNYDRTFGGSMTIRTALSQSRNIPPIVIGQKIGLEKVIDVCRVLGIESPIAPVISLPLGSVDLTPLEITSAYATFANNGWQSETTSIVQVTDSSGHILLDNKPKPRLVLDPWAAASLNVTLTSVVEGGTGKAADFGRQAAGKTGTTSSERDVWFVGYVPQLAAAVWAGNDDYTRMGGGATGGGLVAPVWRDFMQQALRDEPVEYFTSPSKFSQPRPQ